MKNTILLLLLLSALSCKAQIYPLDTYYETLPNNAHRKDLGNIYNKYVGTWKANAGNKIITLYIEKQLDRYTETLNKTFYDDVLLIRYKVEINGQVVESTQNLPINEVNIVSDGPDINDWIGFLYNGGKCGVGWGDIVIKTIDNTHLKWNYMPQPIILSQLNCPNDYNSDIKIYLPDRVDYPDLVFTKQ